MIFLSAACFALGAYRPTLAQCAPALALPDPAAIKGASKRKSIAADCLKSQAMNSASKSQKSRALLCLESIALSKSYANKRSAKCNAKPNPAMKTTGRYAA